MCSVRTGPVAGVACEGCSMRRLALAEGTQKRAHGTETNSMTHRDELDRQAGGGGGGGGPTAGPSAEGRGREGGRCRGHSRGGGCAGTALGAAGCGGLISVRFGRTKVVGGGAGWLQAGVLWGPWHGCARCHRAEKADAAVFELPNLGGEEARRSGAVGYHWHQHLRAASSTRARRSSGGAAQARNGPTRRRRARLDLFKALRTARPRTASCLLDQRSGSADGAVDLARSAIYNIRASSLVR
jgi:hypothetical protein